MNQEYYALVQEIHQEKLDLADKSKVMHAAETLVLMAFTGHLRGGYLAYNCGSWLNDQFRQVFETNERLNGPNIYELIDRFGSEKSEQEWRDLIDACDLLPLQGYKIPEVKKRHFFPVKNQLGQKVWEEMNLEWRKKGLPGH